MNARKTTNVGSVGSQQSTSNLINGGPKNNNNFMAIRQEIQRFESVHPNIYSIYDLVDLINDPVLAHQIREHVVCIEGKRLRSLSKKR